MARLVELSTYLDAAPDTVWKWAGTSSLLDHIAAPMIRFAPHKETPFPARWNEQEYRATIWLFGILPIGWQALRISFPPNDGEQRIIRDDGYSPLIRRWDHHMIIAPEGTGTRYTDRVTLEAGLLTPLAALFARTFYRHRQKRWAELAQQDFAALE